MYRNTRSRYRGSSGRPGVNANRRAPARRGGSLNHSLFINKAINQVVTPDQAGSLFSDFALDQRILDTVKNRGLTTPTPIQDQAIPVILQGKDVIGIADTGTGKTAAFLLPLLNKIYHNRSEKLLIIAPTRELAVQIEQECKAFSPSMGIFTALCIGQNNMNYQIRLLGRNPQVIIGTPGRLYDHIQRRTINPSLITNLVVDEADRLVDLGFITTLRNIISTLPETRQSLFFSATINHDVQQLLGQFTRNPETVSVKNRDTSLNVEQDVILYTDPFHRMNLLHDLLIKPELKKVLIFSQTKHGTEKLHLALVERGFSSVCIHGNKNQNQRQKALNEFKDNRTQILVATDVAARGLDIPDVSHVINFDTPEKHIDYIHRIGRTGRADKKGVALTFVK